MNLQLFSLLLLSNAPHTEITNVLHDVDERGQLWVRGANYKAGFDPDGVTFIPFLGASAPRDCPVRWTLADVRSGATSLPFARHAAPVRDGERIVYERAGCTESFLTALDGLEQTFTFADAPRDGDLTVSLDTETELQSRVDSEGVRFENERGHVRYGRAFALDASGRKIEIEERSQGGRIDLVVPQEFLVDAEFPVTIDPVISTIAIDTDSDDDFNSDVAYDLGAGSFVIVNESAFSGNDHDVFWRKLTDGVLVASGAFDISPTIWSHPRIADNNLANQFLCVAEVGVAPNRIILGREMNAITNAVGAEITISGAEPGDKHNPDVGGDPTQTAPSYYCVVWQRDFSATEDDIHYRLVFTNGTPVGAGVEYLSTTPNHLSHNPSVSKGDGTGSSAGRSWNVVWQYEYSSSDEDVYGARISRLGSVLSPPFGIATSASNETEPNASPPIDSNPTGIRPWMCAYAIEVSSIEQIYLRAFDESTFLAGMNLTQAAGGTTLAESVPQIDTDGSQFVILHQRSNGSFPFTSDLFASTVYYVQGAVGITEANRVVDSSGISNSYPSLATVHTAGSSVSTRACMTYTHRAGISSDHDIYAALYDTPEIAGFESFCFGTASACPCGNGGDGLGGCANSVNSNGARLSAGGLTHVSSDRLILFGEGMPATSTCIYFQGSVTPNGGHGTLWGDGLLCASGTIHRLGVETNSNGTSYYPHVGDAHISVRGLVPAAGGTRYYQAYYRNNAAFCTGATFNATQALQIVWLP